MGAAALVAGPPEPGREVAVMASMAEMAVMPTAVAVMARNSREQGKQES
jgi:hypothetical protein